MSFNIFVDFRIIKWAWIDVGMWHQLAMTDGLIDYVT